MSDFKSDTCTIQLIDAQDRDIDLMAIVLSDDGTPLLGRDSVCFYNSAEVNDVKVRVGERTKACYARLTDEIDNFDKTDCELDWHVRSQIKWDGRFKIALAIACFEHNGIKEHRVFKGWNGFVRIVSRGKELARFDAKDLGDLSKTGCIEIGTTNPLLRKFLSSKPTLPINGDVVKYSNTSSWIASHGLESKIQGDDPMED